MAKRRRKAGYLRILTSGQIYDACEMSKDNFVPAIATQYGLTINQCLHMLRKELYAQYIKFEKYGNKEYCWTDSETKLMVKKYMDEGKNDDEIAKLMETSYFAVSRGRSTAGLVAYNRIVAKGHNSKHHFTHTIVTKNTVQGDLFHTQNTGTPTTNVQHVMNDEKNTIVVNEYSTKELTVCFDKDDDVPTHIKETIVMLITWRSICMRVQNPEHLYGISNNIDTTYYYKQVQVDPYHNLVTLKLVKKVTPKVAK